MLTKDIVEIANKQIELLENEQNSTHESEVKAKLSEEIRVWCELILSTFR